MTYTTIFGEDFENEFDEKMTHKYGDKYKCVKSVYPDVYKLPESEIQPMTYIARYKGDTVDEAKDFVRKYIKEKEPLWKKMCFIDDNKNIVKNNTALQNNDNETNQSNILKVDSGVDLGAFAKCYKPLNFDLKTLEPELTEFQADREKRKQQSLDEMTKEIELKMYRNELTDALYNHLKDDDIEGYYRQAYCDTTGNPTVGVGLNMSNKNFMNNMTVTPQSGPISQTNRPLTKQQKDEYWNLMKNHCESYYIGKDEKGNKKYEEKSALKTIDEFEKKENVKAPYFQDDELERKSKNYIRNSLLPVLEKKMKNIGKDLYKDFTKDGRIGEADLLYNLGENKFRLNPNGKEPEDWSSHAKALINGDAIEAARQSHRKNVGPKRNDNVYEKISKGLMPKDLEYSLNGFLKKL